LSKAPEETAILEAFFFSNFWYPSDSKFLRFPRAQTPGLNPVRRNFRRWAIDALRRLVAWLQRVGSLGQAAAAQPSHLHVVLEEVTTPADFVFLGCSVMMNRLTRLSLSGKLKLSV